VILDPPRAGCDPQLLRALPATTELVILISCGLPGLKRDAALLSQLGWRVDRLVAHDLFPHTPHAEVVTRWRRD
jgi:tRNA/tmRNA/rRNA uracil-C5-methylase (TrmA/RlmC/RlmD family)